MPADMMSPPYRPLRRYASQISPFKLLFSRAFSP